MSKDRELKYGGNSITENHAPFEGLTVVEAALTAAHMIMHDTTLRAAHRLSKYRPGRYDALRGLAIVGETGKEIIIKK
jgi:hypothetical protein